MKYSSTLLKRFINISDSLQNLSDNLILKTVEVEEIIERTIPESIVIWKIIEVKKHPDADKLNICMVDCGDKGIFQIICGGSNVAVWLYVPTALAGTYFPKVDIKIEARNMRWVESNGMICAKVELDINEDLDTHGIWDMAWDFDDLSDADLGKALTQKYSRLDTYVIDVDNKGLTHRPDLTWHFGIGIEFNSIFANDKISFNKIPEYFDTFEHTNILEILTHSKKPAKKIICETEKLNTYTILELNDVEVKNSTFWTRLQTLDLGSKPINNWVDFSNLFMNISGQPVHFFDADKIVWNIVIRNAKDGEKFIDLFEAEHSLLTTDIVIADEEKILALGGVVWWLESWVTDSTKNIVVEIANFDPVAVRKTWVRLGLRTDAELRYEKNINPLFSLNMLVIFLDQLGVYKKDLGNYTINGIDYYISDSVNLQNNKSIVLDYTKMSVSLFGQEVEWFEKQAKDILIKLWFKIQDNNVIPPFWRSPDDINIEQDLYEEVARIYWYDKIPELEIKSTITNSGYSPSAQIIRLVEDIFVKDNKFNQVETYPWISEKSIEMFAWDLNNHYKLKNPISENDKYLREDLVAQLIKYIVKNGKFFEDIQIFDIGKAWDKLENKETEESKEYACNLVNEKLVLWAMIYRKSVKNRQDDVLFDAKSYIQNTLNRLWLAGSNVLYKKTELSSYHPKKQAEILFRWKNIGFVWAVHPLIMKNNKLPDTGELVYIKLNLNILSDMYTHRKINVGNYETLQDQIVWRDLCFVIDEHQDFSLILDTVKAIKEVKNISVFDLYQWENLPVGKKSIAIKIKITWENMTTEHINEIMNKAIAKVQKNWGELRS